MIKILLYNIIFIILLTPFAINAQLSSIEIYGTKSNGLGGISTIFKDVNAGLTNQAGLAYISGTEMIIGYENKYLSFDLSAMNIAIAKNFKNIGTLGLSIKKFGINEFNEIQLGASYARKLNNATAIALQINLFNLSIDRYGNKTSASFETGIMYDISKNITIGFHISNPFPIKFNKDINLPTIAAFGIKYSLSHFLSIYGEIEKHIKHDMFLKTAVEYSPLTAFSIYLGFKFNTTAYSDYSMGIMYKIKNNLVAELCTTYDLTLGLSPSIGISYKK